MSEFNRAEAIVDLTAIKANIKHLMSRSGKPALAVVKADAYGHGLIPVAKRALESGASWLGVALLEEALTLRAAGITAPIIAWLTSPSAFSSWTDWPSSRVRARSSAVLSATFFSRPE